jgi:hypothetical protein
MVNSKAQFVDKEEKILKYTSLYLYLKYASLYLYNYSTLI